MPQIEWKDVFNCNKLFPENFHICREKAKAVGYGYMSFNGLVYSTSGVIYGESSIGAENWICKEEDLIVSPEKEVGVIADEIEYIDFFDDNIWELVKKVGKAKGYNIDNDLINNEIVAYIRNAIIAELKRLTVSHVDLSPPEEEYNVGDNIFFDNEECKIILLDDENYGFLSLEFYNVTGKVIGDLKSGIRDYKREGRIGIHG